MPLPAHVLTHSAPMDVVYSAGEIIDQYAESMSGTAFDPDIWEEKLGKWDFHLAMLVHFLGTWEGSGSFVNEADDWRDQEGRIKSSLVAFGCERAAQLFDEAAELSFRIGERCNSDKDISPEQATRREEINREANEDVSYEKLANFLRAHRDRFIT
jgi:hypothetical protein